MAYPRRHLNGKVTMRARTPLSIVAYRKAKWMQPPLCLIGFSGKWAMEARSVFGMVCGGVTRLARLDSLLSSSCLKWGYYGEWVLYNNNKKTQRWGYSQLADLLWALRKTMVSPGRLDQHMELHGLLVDSTTCTVAPKILRKGCPLKVKCFLCLPPENKSSLMMW